MKATTKTEAMRRRLDEFDLAVDAIYNNKDQLWATPIEESFDKIIRRFVGVADNDNYGKNLGFLDLGSGTGHAIFYFHDMFPLAKCVGVEFDPVYHREAQRRQAEMRIPEDRVKLLNKDIFELDGQWINGEFGSPPITHLIVYSFDSVMKKPVRSHIHSLIVKNTAPIYQGRLTWITTSFHPNIKRLEGVRLVTAPPGIDELTNTATTRVEVVKWPDDDEGESEYQTPRAVTGS